MLCCPLGSCTELVMRPYGIRRYLHGNSRDPTDSPGIACTGLRAGWDFARNGISRGTGFPSSTGINVVTLSVIYRESFWSPYGTDVTPRLEPQTVVCIPISVHFSMEPVDEVITSNPCTLVPLYPRNSMRDKKNKNTGSAHIAHAW